MKSTLANGTVRAGTAGGPSGPGVVAALSAVVLAASLAACSSTNSTSTDNTSSTKATIPKSAFSDHTGITATTVSVGNVSTLLEGIFKGAAVGTEAYADYVNSRVASTGARSSWTAATTSTPGRTNKDATQEDIGRGLRHGGRLLALRQLRRHRDPGQPPGAQRDRVLST